MLAMSMGVVTIGMTNTANINMIVLVVFLPPLPSAALGRHPIPVLLVHVGCYGSWCRWIVDRDIPRLVAVGGVRGSATAARQLRTDSDE